MNTLKDLNEELEKLSKKMIRLVRKEFPKLFDGVDHQHRNRMIVETLVLSSVQMKKWNQKTRGKSKDTDVLSLPHPQMFQKQGYLGTVLVSKSKLVQQARERSHSVQQEMLVLWIHGFLHLLGFDHEKSKKEAEKMRKLENKILFFASKKNLGLLSRV